MGFSMKTTAWVQFALLFVIAACNSALAADTDIAPHAASHDRPAIEIGGGISNDGGSGDVNFLAPLIFSDGKDLLFFGADAKFSGFNINDTSDTVYNVGGYLGYRRLLDDEAGVVGLWAGIDYFNTDRSHEFARAIAGVEYFGSHVIARANGFVPLDSTSGSWSVTSAGFITTYDEKVPGGIDAEIGLRLAVPMDSFVRPGEFRIFAGGYDYIALYDDGGDVLGGRARAELDLYPFMNSPATRLSLEAAYAYDKHSGDQYGAGIKLSIPLGVTNKIREHGAKDHTIAELDSFGQDLFQTVKRSRSNVSRIRTLDRRAVAGNGGGNGGTGGGTAGVSLSNVCGGASGTIALKGGSGSGTILQGAEVGIIDPGGANAPLNLTLANMVAPNGQTLAQLLAPGPKTINTTLTFPPSTVDFAAQMVQPDDSVAVTGSAAILQRISSVTVSVNGGSCSMTVETASAGVTMANVCGGANANIAVNSLTSPGLFVTQGSTLAFIEPAGANTPLVLDLSVMVNGAGQHLPEILANPPNPFKVTLRYPPGIADFTTQTIVTNSAIFAATQLSLIQIVIAADHCEVEMTGSGSSSSASL
jgi:hypothetical protein